MTDHPEIEQLSSYVDGELTAVETAQLEAHLPGCAECTHTLSAIRATLDDLSLLAAPQLDGASIAAIDRRIAAERQTRRSFARRWGLVSSAAAAALVALLVFVGVVRNDVSTNDTATRTVSEGAGQALNTSGTDYTEESLATALTAYGAPSGVPNAVGVPMAGSQSGGEDHAGRDFVADSYSSSSDQFATCKRQIERADAGKTSVRSEAARFKGQPAFVFFYTRPRENPTYAEVWVLRPSDCYTLYFAQTRI